MQRGRFEGIESWVWNVKDLCLLLMDEREGQNCRATRNFYMYCGPR